MADRLSTGSGVTILNEVVLNQVLVRFSDPSGKNDDEFTANVIDRVQEDGTCWLGAPLAWHACDADIDFKLVNDRERYRPLAEAILRCAGNLNLADSVLRLCRRSRRSLELS